MKRDFFNALLILLLSICILFLAKNLRSAEIDLATQMTEIESLRLIIAELRDQVEDRALKEDISSVYSETAAYDDRIIEISERLLLVEENQQFYKNVWREYFGLKRELP